MIKKIISPLWTVEGNRITFNGTIPTRWEVDPLYALSKVYGVAPEVIARMSALRYEKEAYIIHIAEGQMWAEKVGGAE